MIRKLLLAAPLLLFSGSVARANDDIGPSYGIGGTGNRPDKFVSQVVIGCASHDGSVTAVPCGTSQTPLVVTIAGGTLSDANSAAFQGAATITPGTPVTAARSIGFIITAAGNVTLTLADSSTITLALVASPQLQTLPFAVTNVALGSGTAGTFWNLK